MSTDLTPEEERFFSRKLPCYCMAMSRDGRGCVIDRDVHAGIDHKFSELPVNWRAPTAEEYRTDLDTLSGGISMQEIVEMYYPGMSNKEK